MPQELMSQDPKPLDPDSEKGREVAARLSQVLAEIFLELDAQRGVGIQVEREEQAA
jgi:hypothetical protein